MDSDRYPSKDIQMSIRYSVDISYALDVMWALRTCMRYLVRCVGLCLYQFACLPYMIPIITAQIVPFLIRGITNYSFLYVIRVNFFNIAIQ